MLNIHGPSADVAAVKYVQVKSAAQKALSTLNGNVQQNAIGVVVHVQKTVLNLSMTCDHEKIYIFSGGFMHRRVICT